MPPAPGFLLQPPSRQAGPFLILPQQPPLWVGGQAQGEEQENALLVHLGIHQQKRQTDIAIEGTGVTFVLHVSILMYLLMILM